MILYNKKYMNKVILFLLTVTYLLLTQTPKIILFIYSDRSYFSEQDNMYIIVGNVIL